MTDNRNYTGDLSKTAMLDRLFNSTLDQRDDKWQASFLQNISEASLMATEPQVIVGPDRFPYFQLFIPTPNQSFQCFVIKHMIDDFLLSNGLGVVINPHKHNPDWVFSYGDLLNYKLNQAYYSKHSENKNIMAEKETLAAGTQCFTGQPSESILPSYTRKIIKKVLSDIFPKKVKVLFMYRTDIEKSELIFNITPDDFNQYEEYQYVMNIISWYLPRHYSIAGTAEKNHEQEFEEL